MLIIDEAGGWLNARTWQSVKRERINVYSGDVELVTERELIIDWLTQSRKRFWDIYLIAQAAEMLDKQVRVAVGEGVVRIRRLDRFRMGGVTMPRVHIAVVRYGLDLNAPVIERWFYRGADAQRCFGSYRLFGSESRHYSILPASQTKWRDVPRATLTRGGWAYLAVGWSGCVLLLANPRFAFLWLLIASVLGWFSGQRYTTPKRLWGCLRLRRWRGVWGDTPMQSMQPASVLASPRRLVIAR